MKKCFAKKFDNLKFPKSTFAPKKKYLVFVYMQYFENSCMLYFNLLQRVQVTSNIA